MISYFWNGYRNITYLWLKSIVSCNWIIILKIFEAKDFQLKASTGEVIWNSRESFQVREIHHRVLQKKMLCNAYAFYMGLFLSVPRSITSKVSIDYLHKKQNWIFLEMLHWVFWFLKNSKIKKGFIPGFKLKF